MSEKKLNRVVLEMSLKPFKKIDDEYIANVWREVFRQWGPLYAMSSRVAVLFWTGDGLEILKWRGNMEDEVVWAQSIGHELDPYVKNPPTITYSTLKNIVSILKRVAEDELGLDIQVGTTIDPGPEFVKNDFYYEKHRELLPHIGGVAQHAATSNFIVCWAKLHADSYEYAGYPNGIPEGTSFGEFLGRQCRYFLPAMGFDYIWFSNGFGFSHYPWSGQGINFDGGKFGLVDYEEIAQEILGFWEDYKRECPDFPVEIRGTNVTVGVDMASHCVRLNDIYGVGLVKKPAPNPPWGDRSLDLEITSQMSRIAHLPGDEFVCRLYINDPWYYANPWWDYYNREWFDIYSPIAVGRMNGEGGIENPTHIELLTIDTELGDLNENTAIEVVPHIRRAITTAPDEPGLLTWLYPYDEYDHIARQEQDQVGRAFFYDMFARYAIRDGFPLNTVISSDNFKTVLGKNPGALSRTIIVAPTPLPGCSYESELVEWVRSGGKALLYGAIDCASDELLALLNLKISDPIEGELTVDADFETDEIELTQGPKILKHLSPRSGGKIHAVLASETGETSVRAWVSVGDKKRVYALTRTSPDWNGGRAAWVRGSHPETNSMESSI